MGLHEVLSLHQIRSLLVMAIQVVICAAIDLEARPTPIRVVA